MSRISDPETDLTVWLPKIWELAVLWNNEGKINSNKKESEMKKHKNRISEKFNKHRSYINKNKSKDKNITSHHIIK